MPNINTKLQDEAIGHGIYLLGYSESVANDMLKLLVKSERSAREVFDARLVRIQELGFDSGPATSKRAEKLITELGAAIEQLRIDESFKQLELDLTGELDRFADYEASYIATSSNRIMAESLDGTGFAVAFQSVAPAAVIAAARARPFTISPGKSAKTLGDYIAGMSAAERVRIQDAVRTGVVNGETTQNIVRSVWGTIQERKNNTGSAAVIKTRRGAEMLVRTAIKHISATAQDIVYNENSDLIKELIWTSVLDSRTTDICQGRDGNRYPPNKGPRPPAHAACRSVMTPVLRTYRELGIDVDEPERSTRAYLAIPEHMNVTQYRAKLRSEGLTRAQQDKIISSLSGQTDDPTFDAFLSRQTLDFQEKALKGKTRALLYREGGLSLKDLINPKGNYYTLDQLRELQPSAFDKIGG